MWHRLPNTRILLIAGLLALAVGGLLVPSEAVGPRTLGPPVRPFADGTPTPSYLYLPLVMRNYHPPPPPPVYPNDLYYTSGYQWGLNKVRAPEAWALSKGTGVLIAVLDTGTDYTHPDLAGKVRTDIDYDFFNNDTDAMDDNDHGTHVSGIAAAATDNGRGVAGLGWEATVLPVKVIGSSGSGNAYVLTQGIYYAADRGARVINMSLGGGGSCPDFLQTAVDYAYGRGVLLVAAAGNAPDIRQPPFPANCAHVLGVAATNSYDGLAYFSVTGTHVSVAAPGVGIYSTVLGGGYESWSGTSMATPFVAGLAALVWARFPTYTPDQVASAILDNAQDLGPSGWDIYYGCGRIDAFRALWEGARGGSPLCLGTVAWSVGDGEQGSAGAEAVPGEVVVTVRAGARAENLFGVLGLRMEGASGFRTPLGTQVWRVRVPVGQEEAVAARLRADPAVLSADRNYVLRAQ